MVKAKYKLLRIVSVGLWVGFYLVSGTAVKADDMAPYYRIISIATPKAQTESRSSTWKPAPDGLPLEVSGLAVVDDQRLAVAIRKGEIWIVQGALDDPPNNVTYERFATALHEPLGLLWHDGAFYTTQRSELTRIRDTNSDGIADEYRSVAKGWGVTGHYHEYAYGPELDGAGNMWVTLNIGLGLKGEQLERTVFNSDLRVRQGRWRGWGLIATPHGQLQPMCAGMRSPSGMGANAAGDMFYTDQQGNWVATNTLHHMRSGAFFHHPEALASSTLPESPIKGIREILSGIPYPEAIRRLPQMKPPAIWFPYKKVGQSPTDIVLDNSQGRFGPFHGQLFIGEFTLAGIHRVYLEKIHGEYQGACFPFRSGFASAVLRLAQAADGSLLVGLTNRGWSSLGDASYGLQRLVWTGVTPFEIRELRAKHDGFELHFTQAVDRTSAQDVNSYSLASHTYLYHATYGSDEIDHQQLAVRQAIVSDDGLQVRLVVDGLRELYVHELIAGGVRNRSGHPLVHADAYYTLNHIPAEN